MSDAFELNAEARDSTGKGASRRLRRQADRIPAILYGGGKTPTPLTLVRKDLEHALENEAFYSHILTIKVGGTAERAILKDLQRHPARDRLMHADFMRVSDDVKIKVNVPLHFLNEDSCRGVKTQGGMIQHSATDIEVQCLPADMPEYLEVDMADIEIGQIVHISDIELPAGVESVALTHGEAHDLAIANVLAPRGAAADEEDIAEAGEETATETPAEETAAGEGEE